LADAVPDRLVEINLTNGAQRIIPLDDEYTFDTITLHEQNNTILFTDTRRTGLFEVAL